MSRTVGLITELEVVNSVLSVAGDNPVSSLDDEYQPVFIIKKMINDISRSMQTKGYWFNSEYDVTLEPNTITNRITLPFNLLKFEPKDTRYIARGLEVYDRESRTSTVEDSIIADITLMLTFEQLPQSAREYIKARCRNQYNSEYFGEVNFKQDLAVELQEAKMALDKEHIENEDINIFNSQKVNNIAFKNRRRS